MKKEELKKRGNILNLIAQSQALSGKMLKIGEGMVSSKIEQTPFRILDECPVYHSSSNEFNLADLEFKRDKTHLWGKFYHPFLMMGMPDVGGWIALIKSSLIFTPRAKNPEKMRIK